MAIVTVTSDFVGKIAGSLIENPNIARRTMHNGTGNLDTSANVRLPSEVGELTDAYILGELLPTKNNSGFATSADYNTRAQIIFSFDVIAAIEKQSGQTLWRGKTLLAEKINIAKEIVQSATGLITGYGRISQINTYKCYMSALTDSNAWDTPIIGTQTNWADMLKTINLTGYIDSTGYVHFTVYTDLDPTADATANAILNVDYAKLDITLDDTVEVIPSVPTNVMASAQIGQISIAWVGDSNATSYNVQRKTGGEAFVTVGNTAETTYEDTSIGLLDTSTYTYRINAMNDSGESDYSAEVSIAAIPQYLEHTIFIDPKHWANGELPQSIIKELVTKYNATGKRQSITSQHPIVCIRTNI